MVFALGVETLALGALGESGDVARAGAVLLTTAAVVALACALETVHRVVSARPA